MAGQGSDRDFPCALFGRGRTTSRSFRYNGPVFSDCVSYPGLEIRTLCQRIDGGGSSPYKVLVKSCWALTSAEILDRQPRIVQEWKGKLTSAGLETALVSKTDKEVPPIAPSTYRGIRDASLDDLFDDDLAFLGVMPPALTGPRTTNHFGDRTRSADREPGPSRQRARTEFDLPE